MLVYNRVALLNNGGRHRDVILCSAWNIVFDLPFAKKAAAGRCGSLFAAEKLGKFPVNFFSDRRDTFR